MKKSQILAALALAFALGVAVIPAADTYAKVVVYDDNNIPITDEATESKVQEAITAGKSSCGWHLVNTTKTYYYDQYLTLNTALETAAGAVKTVEKTQYGTLKETYKDTIGTLKTTLNEADPAVKLPDGVKTEFTDDVKTYSQAVTFINRMLGYLREESTEYATGAIYTAYVTAINALSNATYNGTEEGALLTADKAVETVKKAQAGNIEDKIIVITEDDKDTDIDYATAVKKANDLKSTENGTCSVAKAVNLEKAINYAQNMLDSNDNFSVADANKAIENIKKAMNGGTVTDGDVNVGEGTNKPGDEAQDPNAPDTGILADAEANASTTVAMVAGIATALTAAGAGVVAYRNARRSTRK